MLENDTLRFYCYWKKKYLRKDPYAVDDQYYILYKTDDKKGVPLNATVSEAHGYGMLIAACLHTDDKEKKNIFDGLYRYYRAHLSGIGQNLMAWKQVDNGSEMYSSEGEDSAADGDLDIAYSLLMADKIWGSAGGINYRKAAAAIINDIMTCEIDEKDHFILLGDWVSRTGEGSKQRRATRSSDFIMQYFPAFARATGDERWKKVYDNTYAVINSILDKYGTGLLPDFMIKDSNSCEFLPAPAGFLEGEHDGDYFYNSCRVPWRIGADAIITKNENALRFSGIINKFITENTGSDPKKIKAGYTVSGEPFSHWSDLCFTAPFLLTAAAVGNIQWHDALRNAILTHGEDIYYGDTIAMLCLITDDGGWVSV